MVNETNNGIQSTKSGGSIKYLLGFGVAIIGLFGVLTIVVGEARKAEDPVIALFIVVYILAGVAGAYGMYLLIRFIILHVGHQDTMSPQAVAMLQEAQRREFEARVEMLRQQLAAAATMPQIGAGMDGFVRVDNNQMVRKSKILKAADEVWVVLHPAFPPTRDNIAQALAKSRDPELNGTRGHALITSIQQSLVEQGVAEGGGTPGRAYTWKQQ